MLKKILTSEKHPSKIEAVFDSPVAAQDAREKLADFTVLKPSEVMVIKQGDRDWSKKIEPELRGIQHTLLKTHFIFGSGGLAIGWIFGWGLVIANIPLAASNPLFTSSITAFLGLMIGLLFAGLATLRPDHDPIIQHTRKALKNGKTVLIVHAKNHNELQRAEEALKSMSDEVRTTF